MEKLFDKGKLRLRDYQRVTEETLWKDVKLEEKEVNGHVVVDVTLNNEALTLTVCLGTYIRQRARREKLVEIFEGNYSRDIIGMEGNLAVAAYIYGNYLEALGYISFGKGDSCDIEIGAEKADVKTGTKPSFRMLMIGKKQWLNPEKRIDLYIGCTEMKEDTIRIWGYATRQDVEQFIDKCGWNFKNVALQIPLQDLRDIRELKDNKGK